MIGKHCIYYILSTINIENTLFFFNKDQQKIFEAGMSLAYPQIKAQMFLKRP